MQSGAVFAKGEASNTRILVGAARLRTVMAHLIT